MLNDNAIRKHLTYLDMNDIYNDEVFLSARANSHLFQDALTRIFITDKNPISEFTLKSGIF